MRSISLKLIEDIVVMKLIVAERLEYPKCVEDDDRPTFITPLSATSDLSIHRKFEITPLLFDMTSTCSDAYTSPGVIQNCRTHNPRATTQAKGGVTDLSIDTLLATILLATKKL